MSTSKYIRPMSFRETIGTMYKLYLKIMLPILLLNTILVAMSWWVLVVGAFVGPILLMTSNAILNKPLRVWDSLIKGIFSWAFLKIAVSSIAYIVILLVISSPALIQGSLTGFGLLAYLYLFFLPVWIFIPMVMLLEKTGLRASVKGSFQILRNDFSRIFRMTLFLTGFIAVMALAAMPLLAGNGYTFAENYAMFSLFAMILPLFTGFSSLPYVFVYYEYRARYENYSEELLTEELGYQPIEEMMTV